MPRNLTRVRNTRPSYLDSELAALTPADWDSTIDEPPVTAPRRRQSFGWPDIVFLAICGSIAVAIALTVAAYFLGGLQ